MDLAFQDQYPEQFSHCFGCGRNNPAGHQIKSYWDGDRTIARFTPGPQYTGGVPEHAYGGLVASLMDCHGAATAFAYARRDSDADEDIRYVTASLTVDFRRPTQWVIPLTQALPDAVAPDGRAPRRPASTGRDGAVLEPSGQARPGPVTPPPAPGRSAPPTHSRSLA